VVVAIGTALYMGQAVALATILYFRYGGAVEDKLEEAALAPRREGGTRRKTALVVLLSALAIATVLTASRIDDALGRLDRHVEVTAHRGSSGEAPENTMAAIRLAVEDGAQAVEFDVMETGDGQVVVFHDTDLERVTGVKAKIWDKTAAELAELDIGSHFDPRFSGERIPTLDDVLAFAKGRVRLNIEVKPHEREKNMARSVVDAIHRHGMQENVVITSNDYPILQRIRALDPDLRIGSIIAAKVGKVEALDVDFYSVQPKIATVAFVRRAHAIGRDVHVWTVNERARMEEMLDNGVDVLITDWPKRALEVLESRSDLDELNAAVLRLFRR